jgi:hydroxymethylglutaryl-CoA lyase
MVTDVGPRDGFQSEPKMLSTAEKVAVIDALAQAGLPRIEATSFVHPRAVPQMADAASVLASISRRPGVHYTALVPNVRGAERALAAAADALNVVVLSTETMNQRNVQLSVAESIAACGAIVRLASEASTPVIASIGTSFGCPIEGDVPQGRIVDIVERLVDAGVDEITLADTVGVANPRQVESLALAVQQRWPAVPLGLHFHDTRGLGLANVLVGLQAGVSRFDASVAGIGACPFAPGATGNVCTEDLVHLLDSLDVATGVDLAALIETARLVRDTVGHDVPSRLLKAGPRPHHTVAQ